jgi:hypothetical protein
VYLGVHFVSDVLAGYCAGLVWLTACIGASRFAERRGLASPSCKVGCAISGQSDQTLLNGRNPILLSP